MASFGSATLVLKGPKGAGITIELNGARVTIGRSPDSDVLLKDTSISAEHCEFVKENDALIVRDIGSSNGTYVNGRRVQAVRLFNGDVIRVGQCEGAITVKQPGGQPLDTPGSGSPLFTAFAALVVLLLLGAGAYEFWFYQRQHKERARFAAFEQKTQALLLTRSPCALVQDALPKLSLTLPDASFAKQGKQGKADREVARKFLVEASAPLEQQLAGLVKELGEGALAKERQDRQPELTAFAGQFTTPELASAVDAVRTTFERQAELVIQLREGLK
jgi:predicted component of type VI protein secretion system